jgi:hypothetical protein
VSGYRVNDRRRRPEIPASIPNPVKAKLAEARAEGSRAVATVRVQEFANRQEIASRWPAAPDLGANLTYEARVAPVLADAKARESGLVLAGQNVVVMRNRPGIGSPYGGWESALYGVRPITVWADEATLDGMDEDDWRWVLAQDAERVIPATVTSHVRALAWYEGLLNRGQALPVLQRWGRAIDAVEEGIELVTSLAGSGSAFYPEAPGVLDLTAQAAVASRSRAVMRGWLTQARTVADAAKASRAKARADWLAYATEKAAEEAEPSWPARTAATDAAAPAGGGVFLPGGSMVADIQRTVGLRGFSPSHVLYDEA